MEVSMTKLLVIDTESGGLDPDTHSILSLAGVLWRDGVILMEHEVFILEDPVIVTPKALEVNRIDLVEHAKRAQTPKEAMCSFHSFVGSAFAEEFEKGEPAILVGHNVGFDIGMLKRLCKFADVIRFEELFSHRSLDTAGILRFLHLLGLVPESATSSTGGFAHFGIEVPTGERHTALGDARATAELLTRMMELVRNSG